MSLEYSPARAAESDVGRMLISDVETARLLGCSRATVWRRVADGMLAKPIKIGGLSRFVLSEITATVESAMAARDGEAV